MRILILSNFFPPFVVGGAEIVAERQARALQRLGHDVFILGGRVPAPGCSPGDLEPETFDGLPIQRITLRSLSPDQSFRWPTLSRRLAAIIRLQRIDIVHLHNIVGLGADCIQEVRALGLPCVVTLHDHWGFCLWQSLLRADGTLCRDTEECSVCLPGLTHDGERLPVRLRRDYTAWCLAQANQLIFPSAYLANAYRQAGVGADHGRVLSNGIDLGAIPERDSGVKAGPLRFLCSANLAPHKGIAVILDALLLLAMDPELDGKWEMTIAGHGQLRPAVESLAARPDIPLIVAGHLPRHELLRIMARSDVVVLPSIWPENEPVSLLEGAAAGAALLISRSGGAIDLVQDGKTGLIVPPGDAAALAAAMRRFIIEPGLAAEMGARNHARRAELDEAHTVTQLENIYADIMKIDTIRPLTDRSEVILVGEGTAPEAIIALVDHLHDYLDLRSSFRLLRHDWGGMEGWDAARLVWLWDEKNALPTALTALQRDIPVLAPQGIGLEGWAAAGAPVLLYHTPLEALAYLQILLETPFIGQRLASDATVAADAVWSASTESFELQAERLD